MLNSFCSVLFCTAFPKSKAAGSIAIRGPLAGASFFASWASDWDSEAAGRQQEKKGTSHEDLPAVRPRPFFLAAVSFRM